jgi:hypothetical protein
MKEFPAVSMKIAGRGPFRRVPAACLAAVCWFSAVGMLADQARADVTSASPIPVTSQMIDIGDDPEARISGAPQFDWSFFGERTRPIAKYAHTMPAHRHTLGVNYRFYMLEMDRFEDPPVWFVRDALEDKPAVPTILFAGVGKINCPEEDGEKAKAYDLTTIQPFWAGARSPRWTESSSGNTSNITRACPRGRGVPCFQVPILISSSPP